MSIKILTSDAGIAQKVKAAIYKETQKAPFVAKLHKMANKLQKFIVKKIIASETFNSLSRGILRAEFGLDDFEVSNLDQTVNDVIHITVYHEANGGSFKIIIKFITEDLDLTEVGAYNYTNSEGETQEIHWLFWLLTQGTDTVVSNRVVMMRPGLGRSEFAVMITPKAGGSYSVEGYYAGTPTDNWITRTIHSNIKEIEKIIKDTLSNGP